MENIKDFTIKNEYLTVTVTSMGGELRSICDSNGKEYLWQRDPKYWSLTSPNLFPYIGRLTDETCTYKGQEYHMKIHGFLMYMNMELVSHEEDSLVLQLASNEETRKQYPFEFVMQIHYKLNGCALETVYRVDNCDEKKMYFAVGGHPGFNVPIDENQEFEDYCLDFGEETDANEVGLNNETFLEGPEKPYPMREKRYVDLKHDLFAKRVFILKDIPRKVRLKSKKGIGPAVEMEFPGMKYLGVWHTVGKDAPYVCIEPWSSTGSRQGIIEDLETQENLLSLDPGNTYETSVWIRILGESDV